MADSDELEYYDDEDIRDQHPDPDAGAREGGGEPVAAQRPPVRPLQTSSRQPGGRPPAQPPRPVPRRSSATSAGATASSRALRVAPRQRHRPGSRARRRATRRGPQPAPRSQCRRHSSRSPNLPRARTNAGGASPASCADAPTAPGAGRRGRGDSPVCCAGSRAGRNAAHERDASRCGPCARACSAAAGRRPVPRGATSPPAAREGGGRRCGCPSCGDAAAPRRALRTLRANDGAAPARRRASAGRGLTLDNKLDILGVLLLLASLALVLSSLSSIRGQVTQLINTWLGNLLGWGALAVPLALFAIGLWLIVRHFGSEAPVIDLLRLAGSALVYVGLLLLFQFVDSFNPDYSSIDLSDPVRLRLQLELSWNAGRGGGSAGGELYYLLVSSFGEAGMLVMMTGLLLIGAMLALRVSVADVALVSSGVWRRFSEQRARRARARAARKQADRGAAAPQRESGPDLPARAAEDGGARSIPITMGGRTVTAQVDVGAAAGRAAGHASGRPARPGAQTARGPARTPDAGSDAAGCSCRSANAGCRVAAIRRSRAGRGVAGAGTHRSGRQRPRG